MTDPPIRPSMAPMKFLHTADLHLGRTFHERSLVEDQEYLLAILADELAADDYAALVVSGDVYDRSIPSIDAVNLLGTFLARIRLRFPALAVLLISGNHDSADRLGYADSLFSKLGIHIGSDAEKAFDPVVVEKDGERVAFFLLPFLAPGCLRGSSPELATAELATAGLASAEPLRSQADLAAEAASRLAIAREAAGKAGATATVLVAHLFASGGEESESERVFLGTAERVEAGLFGGFDYVALGHLHRSQRVAPNAWYPGSPLAYSFDEADRKRVFLSVGVGRDGDGDACAVRPIAVLPKRVLRRLKGAFEEFNAPGAFSAFREDYLEIVLTGRRLVENPLVLLRTRYPYLLSIRQDEALQAMEAAKDARFAGLDGVSRREGRRGAADDFALFLGELYGRADPAKLALFETIAREAEHETA